MKNQTRMQVVRDDHIPQNMEGARILEQRKEPEKAAALYEKLSKRSPDDLKILARLIILHRKLKNYKKEMSFINKAIHIHEQFLTSRKKPDRKVSLISKKLNLLLGHTDKKGKPLVVSNEITKLQKRKANLAKKIG